jgi:hypothetical protein
MKTTSTLLVIPALACFFIGATAACRSAKSMLPPRYIVNTEQEARTLGWPQTVAVAGTGSMRPYIPGSSDPNDVVAIAAVECPPYEALNKGDLVIYSREKQLVIHQIVARQGENWIASGLNNSHYDGPVVNRDTFKSRVKRVYILAQAARRLVSGAADAQSVAAPSKAHVLGKAGQGRQMASLKMRPFLKTRRASRP